MLFQESIEFDYSLQFPIHITEHEGIYVLRDDLTPGGTKRRSIDSFLAQTNYEEYIYPGTSRGAAIVALGYAAGKYKKKGVVFIAERQTPNDLMQEALDAGKGYFEYKYIPMGFYPKIKKACERYCAESPKTRLYIKSGNDTPFAVNHIGTVANQIKLNYGKFDVVLSACSSGTLIRGIQAGDVANRYVGIATGQKGIKPGDAEVIYHNEIQKFEANPPKNLRPPYPTVLNYDGKVWQYALEEKKKNPNAKILVWNVWATLDQRELFGTQDDYDKLSIQHS